MLLILVCFVICFSVGLLLSIALIYRDAKPPKPVETNSVSEHLRRTYLPERVVAMFFDVCHAGLSIAGMTATVIVLRSGGKIYWCEIAIQSSLQLSIATNVRLFRQLLHAC